MTMNMTHVDRVEMFRALDDLRAGGSMNMFGASPWLQEMFGLDRRDARAIHADWMRTFSHDVPVEDRAAEHK